MAKQLDEILEEQFSTMTREQQREFIQGGRKSRRTLKPTSKVIKQVKRQAQKRVDKATELFNNLSDADKAKLIKELTK